MSELEELLHRRLVLRDLLAACDSQLRVLLPENGQEALVALDRVIVASGGRNTPTGHAADVYRVSVEFAARRDALRQEAAARRATMESTP